jgi:hypothetical protein
MRIAHLLDNLLTGGRKVVSPRRRPRSTPQKRFLVLISVTDYVTPIPISRPEGPGKLKQVNYLIGIRTRDLLPCSMVPQRYRSLFDT